MYPVPRVTCLRVLCLFKYVEPSPSVPLFKGGSLFTADCPCFSFYMRMEPSPNPIEGAGSLHHGARTIIFIIYVGLSTTSPRSGFLSPSSVCLSELSPGFSCEIIEPRTLCGVFWWNHWPTNNWKQDRSQQAIVTSSQGYNTSTAKRYCYQIFQKL